MQPGRYDMTFVRGTNPPFVFDLLTKDDSDNLVPIEFDDVRLTVFLKETLLFRRTFIVDPPDSPGGIELIDEDINRLRWVPTPEETRLLPEMVEGRNYVPARYELEVRLGDQQIVYLIGTITGIGGINDD